MTVDEFLRMLLYGGDPSLAGLEHGINASERFSPTGVRFPSGREVYASNFGGFASERSATNRGPFGGFINHPTLFDGRLVPNAEARRRALQSGEFQHFPTLDSAGDAARRRSMMLGVMLRNSGLEQ